MICFQIVVGKFCRRNNFSCTIVNPSFFIMLCCSLKIYVFSSVSFDFFIWHMVHHRSLVIPEQTLLLVALRLFVNGF